MAGKKENKNVDAKKKLKDISKVVEDKTFGMKNKNKSKQLEKKIKGLASTSHKGGLEKLEQEIYEEKKRKKLEEENKKLMGDVFAKNVVSGKGPKICQFFKAGLCNKGKKCKFSHDVKVEQVIVEEEEEKEDMRTAKIDLFTDQRELIFGNKNELEEVVNFNAHKYLNANKTDKVCKNFLDAVEKDVYGWNWMCPNGYECVFKHCLPKDYVFKNAKREIVKVDNHAVLDEIDQKRAELNNKKLTPMTFELFEVWKNKRLEKMKKERDAKVMEDLKKAGLKKKGISGVEFFKKNGNVADAEDGIIDVKESKYDKKDDVVVNEDIFNEDEELPDDLD